MRGNWTGGLDGASLPNKYSALPTVDTDEPGAHRGQVMVMFAIFSLVMIGVLGLATDVGFSMAAKRSVQGAADSGAMAGARMIARDTPTVRTRAQAEVARVVSENKLGPITPTLLSCEYIGAGWNVISTCDRKVPEGAAGARVKTRATLETWFIHLIPGAPDTLQVSGYAKARVQNVVKPPTDAPFMVCGDNAWDVTSDPLGIGSTVGSVIQLISSTSPMKIVPAAVGKTYRIHDADLSKKGDADCGSLGNSFTGLTDQTQNLGLLVGKLFHFSTATTPGPVLTTVDGAGGCTKGTISPYNCVMILPIASHGSGTAADGELFVVGFAAFKITQVDANRHNATLLDDFITTGAGGDSWCRDCGGTVVVRLVW